jgi:hypothetical protein
MMGTDQPPVTDAYALFLQARAAVTRVRYPQHIDYTIAVDGIDGGTPSSNHYRAGCDPKDGTIRLFSISDEQLAHPPTPHGVNFSVTLGICIAMGGCVGTRVPVGHPAPYQDLIGEPLLSPTYMFGLEYRGTSTAEPPSSSTGPWPIIAIVSSQAREYRVTLVDMPSIDGTATYHLRLAPLRKPKDNRLRELWIGTSDYLPRRAIVSGNFTVAPLVDVPWNIDFSVVDGRPFVASESAEETLYLAHRRVVRDATIAFQNVREDGGSIYDEPLLTPDATDETLVEPE